MHKRGRKCGGARQRRPTFDPLFWGRTTLMYTLGKKESAHPNHNWNALCYSLLVKDETLLYCCCAVLWMQEALWPQRFNITSCKYIFRNIVYFFSLCKKYSMHTYLKLVPLLSPSTKINALSEARWNNTEILWYSFLLTYWINSIYI